MYLRQGRTHPFWNGRSNSSDTTTQETANWEWWTLIASLARTQILTSLVQMMKVDTSRCSGNEPALLPRKGEPERTAEIKPNGAPLSHSLLTLQMHDCHAVISHQTVLECCLLSQIKAGKNLEKISRERCIIIKRELTPSNLLFILL